MSTNPTATLASFVSGLRHEAIPVHIRQRVLQIVIDSIASAIIGRTGDETQTMERLALKMGGEGASTIIAAPHRLSLVGAALLNGYQTTAVNVCDVYRPAHCHITPVVLPPAIAIAEEHHLSGKEFVTAVAAGLETTCRVGLAINFSAFRDRGWHSPGVIGPFGGAAAVGRLLNLDEARQLDALGLAGSQSAGTIAQWGTPTIKFHQARGSISGLLAGMLAAEGFKAGDDVLANPSGGILSTYSDGGRPESLTDGLGERWELEQISLKRWPSGSGVQTTVSSLFALIEEHDLKPEAVERLRLFLPSGAYRLHGNMEWDQRFTAMLSARYIASVVLHDRRCWVDQFASDRRTDPAVDAFARDRVEVIEDPSLGSSAAVTEVLMSDGTLVRDARDLPKGDPADPYTLDETIDKLRDASDGILPEPKVETALEGLLHLDEAEDVAAVFSHFSTSDLSMAAG